jgi:hypothetical protein
VGVGVGDRVGAAEVTVRLREARSVVDPGLVTESTCVPAGSADGIPTFTEKRPDLVTVATGIPLVLPSQRNARLATPRNPLPLTVIVWPATALVGTLRPYAAAETEPGSSPAIARSARSS